MWQLLLLTWFSWKLKQYILLNTFHEEKFKYQSKFRKLVLVLEKYCFSTFWLTLITKNWFCVLQRGFRFSKQFPNAWIPNENSILIEGFSYASFIGNFVIGFMFQYQFLVEWMPFKITWFTRATYFQNPDLYTHP